MLALCFAYEMATAAFVPDFATPLSLQSLTQYEILTETDIVLHSDCMAVNVCFSVNAHSKECLCTLQDLVLPILVLIAYVLDILLCREHYPL